MSERETRSEEDKTAQEGAEEDEDTSEAEGASGEEGTSEEEDTTSDESKGFIVLMGGPDTWGDYVTPLPKGRAQINEYLNTERDLQYSWVWELWGCGYNDFNQIDDTGKNVVHPKLIRRVPEPDKIEILSVGWSYLLCMS